MAQQGCNDHTQEFDQLLDTLVQRSGQYCRTTPLDDLQRAINLDDPHRTNQVRMCVVRIERALRGCNALDARKDSIAAIVMVLLRSFAGNPDADASRAALAVPRIKDSVHNMAKKYFGPGV